MLRQTTTIRAVIFREGEMWVAQCLEYNLASCGDTRAELLDNLLGQLSMLLERNPVEPFRDFKPAPQRFFRMFEEATVNRKPEPLQPRMTQRLMNFVTGRPRPQVLAAALQ